VTAWRNIVIIQKMPCGVMLIYSTEL